MAALAAMVDGKKLAIVIAAVAFLATLFALVIDASDGLVRASTPLGVALSGVAGVAAGALAARTFPGGALAGGVAGFTNAFVGVGIAMLLREIGWSVLGGGALGGVLLGGVTGVLGHLLVLVVKRRGQPMRR